MKCLASIQVLTSWNIPIVYGVSLSHMSNVANTLHLYCCLSSCSEDQLSCGDGSCLPLSSKCDGVVDCGDELDEQNCHLVEFPVSRIYHASLPPVARDNKQNIIATEVSQNQPSVWLSIQRN